MDDRGLSVNQARIALQFLNDQVNEQTDEVKIIEENLTICQTRVKELRLELTRVQSELSTGGISRPATDRLKKALSKIDIELDNEMLNEEQFKSVLTQEQLKLEQAIIEKSKLDEIDLEIQNREDFIKEFKVCHAAQRVELEASNARNTIATMEREIDLIEQRNAASIERAERQMAEGLKARQETLPLIAKTAQNMSEMREAEEAHLASVYNRRQEGVETLRTELKVNREELVAIHQRKLAAEAREAERERNRPPVVKEKTQMTEGQAKREAYIRAQLDQRLKEEAHDRARLPQQKTETEKAREQNAEDKRKLAKLNQRRMTYFDGNLMAAIMDMDLNENLATRDPYQLVKTKTKAKKWRKRTSTFNRDRFKEQGHDGPDLLIDNESGETPKMKKKAQTKAELLAKKKERHREELERKRRQNAKNRINAQLASKAVVKSIDFVATPSKIIFADYLPSKRYVVKIDLTNVSHQISSIRYHSLSDNLKQICDAMFTPAGALSPGMSTTFRLGFISDTNTDEINGTVKFETPSGFVDIPVLARPPKVEPRLSVTAIDFATQQTGEEVAKVIQLENAGALRGTFDMRIELEPECTQTDMLYELSLSPTEGGQLDAHTTVEIMLNFKPKVTGHLKAQLIINVNALNSEKLIHSYHIPLKGTTIDLPISVSESEFDMSVCTIGFLYQDQFIISNSAKTVRVITFHVPPEAGQMLQVFPKTGYVQAESSLTAQIKFQPDEKVLESEGCLEYYDPDTGVIEFPVTLTVANQAQPIHIYVYGIITGFNLEVSDKKVNFGPCTIYESVWRTITVSNNTMLPQDFGFLDLPTYVTVRPGSGFGTILPNEELNIELIFSAPEAGEFTFDIVLQTVRGFKFTIECAAIGVKPALTLSHQHLSFATALHDTHRLSFYLTNSHTHSDEFKYSVARIGKENVFPVGPTSFCFMFPDDCGFTFSPAVGTILPGEYKFITVMFTPQLSGTDIGNQVKKLELETKMQEEEGSGQGTGLGRKESIAKLDRKKSSVGIRRKKSEALISIAGKNKAVNKNSKFFWQARDYLTRIYQSNEDVYQIPCFIAPGTISMSKTTSLEYRYENSIWIEVKVNRKRPDIVVKSSGGPDYNPDGDGGSDKGSQAGGEVQEVAKKETAKEADSRPVLQLQAKDSKEENIGKTSLDFESQPVGTTVKKTIIIENISDHEVEMSSSLLDPHGPFTMLNPLCELEPGETHAILLTFSPGADKIYHEVMHIYHPTGEGQQDACLNISLRGVGMMPSCSLTAPSATEDGVLPFAPICPGELAQQTLQLRNTSRFPIQFRMYMDSQNPSQILLNPNRPEVFSCEPPTGMLEIGDECEVSVRFSPTEACLGSFTDNLVLRLFGDMKKYGELKLMGNVYQHPLFMQGVQTTGYTPKCSESGVSVSSKKSSQLSPIQAETVVLEMIEKLIDTNGDDDDEDDEDNTYYEGTFTVNATILSNKNEPVEVDGGKGKQKDKKAKSDANKGGTSKRTLSFKVAPLMDGLDLEEVGIELDGAEGDIDWGESKTVKVKATTLDEPFVGLKVTLNSTTATYRHQLVLKPCSFINNIM